MIVVCIPLRCSEVRDLKQVSINRLDNETDVFINKLKEPARTERFKEMFCLFRKNIN